METMREDARKLVETYDQEIKDLNAEKRIIEEKIKLRERLLKEIKKSYRVRADGARKERKPARKKAAAKEEKKLSFRRSQKYADLTVVDATEKIIKGAGRGVHLKEITARLIAGGKELKSKKPAIAVRNVIAKDKRFVNEGKNVFNLTSA